ncbi:Crp/Fnr family transcriptional regulator [Mucilaginibacter aquaedulcis]|uniref:Crp/Fnr family transcriptional regulator n=1 Tax=Mucilaginibacter aquaedulcis TaxID=1187081 RepID=UPI0025B470E0|nr:cyclic nucleotide-binding domain-containing protein [Mucilaginibacter aquaedulcis]MDN3550125.1 cyclic nucleotide-binding domain-containing protein [Mucilaginibacter aquaedulcis]
MSEFEPLIKHIRKRVDMTDDELAELTSYFNVKKIKKKQFIIQPDFVAKHRNYVVEGAFRAYVIDGKGEEHTIQFAIEDWWISDYNSFIHQQPATMFVVALDNSIVLQLTYEQEQKLKAAGHKYETFFRIMAERSAAYQQRRIISNLTQSAEERYTDFLEKYPLVAQRVPQYALASYLGMTTEFLSKIRNNKVRRKS